MKNEIAKFKVKEWEAATQALADEFVKIYFGEDAESWWVSDSIGDVFHVNDYYFNVDDMITAIKLDATFEQLDEYYELGMEAMENDRTIANFKHFIKYGMKYV